MSGQQLFSEPDHGDNDLRSDVHLPAEVDGSLLKATDPFLRRLCFPAAPAPRRRNWRHGRLGTALNDPRWSTAAGEGAGRRPRIRLGLVLAPVSLATLGADLVELLAGVTGGGTIEVLGERGSGRVLHHEDAFCAFLEKDKGKLKVRSCSGK